MNDDKNKTQPSQGEEEVNEKNEEQKLNVKNPFNENDNRVITPEDIESVQEFKEAQTERD